MVKNDCRWVTRRFIASLATWWRLHKWLVTGQDGKLRRQSIRRAAFVKMPPGLLERLCNQTTVPAVNKGCQHSGAKPRWDGIRSYIRGLSGWDGNCVWRGQRPSNALKRLTSSRKDELTHPLLWLTFLLLWPDLCFASPAQLKFSLGPAWQGSFSFRQTMAKHFRKMKQF